LAAIANRGFQIPPGPVSRLHDIRWQGRAARRTGRSEHDGPEC